MPQKKAVVNLEGRIPGGCGINFLSVEFDEESALFGRVCVGLDDGFLKHVLRLDFGSPTFREYDLKGFTEAQQKFLNGSLPKIFAFLGERSQVQRKLEKEAFEVLLAHKTSLALKKIPGLKKFYAGLRDAQRKYSL